MIQTFEFYGTGRQINAQGRFFRYEQGADGSGVTAIRLTIDGNRIGTLEPGDALELPAEASRWDLEPVSSGCVGVVRIGNVRITSDKLQGVVSVVDQAEARTAAGVSFAGYHAAIALAANFSHVHLFNSSTSGKRVCVEQVRVATEAASGVAVYLVTNENAAAGPRTGSNKKVGAADSAACRLHSFRESGAPSVSFASPRLISVLHGGANQSVLYEPKVPLMLSPGTGIVAVAMVANVTLHASLDWYEVNA